MKWLARRRFNHIDVTGVIVCVSLVNAGHFAAGLAVWIGSAVVSVLVEQAAYAKGD
jgi:hypothetical protein